MEFNSPNGELRFSDMGSHAVFQTVRKGSSPLRRTRSARGLLPSTNRISYNGSKRVLDTRGEGPIPSILTSCVSINWVVV
jgi:hypothetical protein